MTKEQVLDINKSLINHPRYKQDVKLRIKMMRRIYRLRKEIAENAANVQTHQTLRLS